MPHRALHRIFWPGPFSFTSMIRAKGPIMLHGVHMICNDLLHQLFPYALRAFICSWSSIVSLVFKACHMFVILHHIVCPMCSLPFVLGSALYYYFISNDQSDSLEAYGWHFRGTQLKGLTWVAKSTWCIREYAWDLQHDDYDGNADPGVCFIRKIHNEISQKSTQMHCGQNDLVALQAYQILTIEQR